MRTLRSTLRLAPALTALALVAAPTAAAGGIRLAPSYVDADVHPGSTLGPLLVTNTSSRPLEMSVGYATATEDVSGLPIYQTSPRDLAAGARLVRVSPHGTRLAPGQSRSVMLEVLRRPRTGIAAYGVVVLLARPLGAVRAGRGATVTSRVRVSADVVLHFPGKRRPRIALEGVTTRRAGGGRAEVVARLWGAGNIDVRRGGTAQILDGAARERAQVALPVVRVLPGAMRESAAWLPRSLPPGRYTARVRVSGSQARHADFNLLPGGQLAEPALGFTRLTASRAGQTAVHARVAVRNAGTRAGSAALRLALLAPGGRTISMRDLPLDSLGPNGSRTIDVDLPQGPGRGSQVLATLTNQGFRLGRTEAQVTAPAPGRAASIEDWLAAHIPLLLASFGALVVAMFAGMLMWARKLSRRSA
jgi:hypothetical protein